MPVKNGSRVARRNQSKLGIFTKGQEARKKLISKSADLFSRYGYDGTSIEAIAKSAGMTKGGPYSYFEGKRELYMSCLEYCLSKFAQLPVGLNTLSEDPHKDLVNHIAWFVGYAKNDPLFRRMVLRGILEEDREIIKIWEKFFANPVTELENRINRVNPHIDARMTAVAVIAVLLIDLETRKFGNVIKKQPKNLSNTKQLQQYILAMIYHAK